MVLYAPYTSGDITASQGRSACFAMLTSSARLPLDAVAMMNFDLSRRRPDGESGQPFSRCQARLMCCFASSFITSAMPNSSSNTSSFSRWMSSTNLHGPSPRLSSRVDLPYQARHSSAKRPQSPSGIPWSAAAFETSAIIESRQLTTVPKTSNISASTFERSFFRASVIPLAYSIWK